MSESLVEELERLLTQQELSDAFVQRLLAIAVKAYAARVERDGWLAPFGSLEPPSASEVCLVASQMLDALSIEVFELALWKTWAYRAGREEGVS
jgi:hypothetical protein